MSRRAASSSAARTTIRWATAPRASGWRALVAAPTAAARGGAGAALALRSAVVHGRGVRRAAPFLYFVSTPTRVSSRRCARGGARSSRRSGGRARSDPQAEATFERSRSTSTLACDEASTPSCAPSTAICSRSGARSRRCARGRARHRAARRLVHAASQMRLDASGRAERCSRCFNLAERESPPRCAGCGCDAPTNRAARDALRRRSLRRDAPILGGTTLARTVRASRLALAVRARLRRRGRRDDARLARPTLSARRHLGRRGRQLRDLLRERDRRRALPVRRARRRRRSASASRCASAPIRSGTAICPTSAPDSSTAIACTARTSRSTGIASIPPSC